MKSKLFDRNIEPRCDYCRYSHEIDEASFLCTKKGIVKAGSSCRSFRYDPLRRTPPKHTSPNFSKWDNENFSL